MSGENVVRVDFQNRRKISAEEPYPPLEFRDWLDTLDSAGLIKVGDEVESDYLEALAKVTDGEPLSEYDRVAMKRREMLKGRLNPETFEFMAQKPVTQNDLTRTPRKTQ